MNISGGGAAWVALSVATALAAFVLMQAEVPGAALLGATFTAIVVGLSGGALRVPTRAFDAAQALIGCQIAASLDASLLTGGNFAWLMASINAAGTLSAGVVAALVLSRVSRVQMRDALWGMMPAVAGAMIAMSEGHAHDSRMVAVIQILRLVIVIVVLAGAGALLADGNIADHAVQNMSQAPVALALLGMIVLLAPRMRRFPPFPFLAALAAGTALGFGGIDVTLPTLLVTPAFIAMGWHVGLRFTPDVIRDAGTALPGIVLGSAILIFSGLLLAVFLVAAMDIDPATAFLATVPGSVDTLTVIALQSDADLAFVLKLQITRMFAVLILTPLISRVFGRA